MKKIVKKILLALLVIMIICIAGVYVYINDYYRADEEAVKEALHADFEIVEEEDEQIVFIPENPVAGLIFYPGGKVEYEAYAPLLKKCADEGILCVLLHMPANLAVLDQNAADGIQDKYPEISNWYIGGHSLGGVMAAYYLDEHADEYEGLILLGSYSSEDLSEKEISVLSIYGSEDGVMSRESYEDGKANLPEDFTEVVIEGGCHSYFGSYGDQEGDGIPVISRQEQMDITVKAMKEFIEGHGK